jgi:hypothetical protein
MNSKSSYSLKRAAILGLDFLAMPAVYPAAMLLKLVRRGGLHRLPICRWALTNVGVFPIQDHYYEPLFRTESLRASLHNPRNLPGVDMNVEAQLAMLAGFGYREELLAFPLDAEAPHSFYYHNSRYGPGDAELLYSMIRHSKPSRLVEIGSGFSTLIARQAILRNQRESPGCQCEHICIEPYEEPWLESCGATVLRERGETIDKEVFLQLGENDMLFIDSSHMIRPGGDVLCEYLEILPLLKPGVLVHVHDIFTPRDYPASWVCDEIRFWNEQYLLEGFLCHNHAFKIVCAANFLKHKYPELMAEKLPVLGKEMWREPGSFWLRRVV